MKRVLFLCLIFLAQFFFIDSLFAESWGELFLPFSNILFDAPSSSPGLQPSGRVIKKASSINHHYPKSGTQEEFDTVGRLVQKTDFDGDGEEYSRAVYQYNGSGELAQTKIYHQALNPSTGKIELSEKYTITFYRDEDQRLVRIVVCDPDEAFKHDYNLAYYTTHKFRLKKIESFEHVNGESRKKATVTLNWDNHSILLEKTNATESLLVENQLVPSFLEVENLTHLALNFFEKEGDWDLGPDSYPLRLIDVQKKRDDGILHYRTEFNCSEMEGTLQCTGETMDQRTQQKIAKTQSVFVQGRIRKQWFTTTMNWDLLDTKPEYWNFFNGLYQYLNITYSPFDSIKEAKFESKSGEIEDVIQFVGSYKSEFEENGDLKSRSMHFDLPSQDIITDFFEYY